MSLIDEFCDHLSDCPRCTPWRPCAEGARILQLAADAVAYRVGPVLVDVSKPEGEA